MDAKTEVSNLRFTVHEEKLLKSSFQIHSNPPSGNDMAFNYSILCQVGLPRTEVLGNEFMRKSGDAWLNGRQAILILAKALYCSLFRMALCRASHLH